MQCAHCKRRGKAGTGFRVAACRCGQRRFFCPSCPGECSGCAAQAVKKRAVEPAFDPLHKPWPVEAAGCPGCVLEMRTGNAADSTVHVCGGPEADDDDEPPAAAPPGADPSPTAPGPSESPGAADSPAEAAPGPVPRTRRTRPKTDPEELADRRSERRRVARAIVRDQRWRDLVARIAEVERELHDAASMRYSELLAAIAEYTRLMMKRSVLKRAYSLSATDPPEVS